MVPSIDLYISDAWVASDGCAHTDNTHTRAQQLVPTRARTYAAVGVSTGDPHIRREILTSLRSRITLSPECCQIFVVCTRAARRHTHTNTHPRTHTRAQHRIKA